MAPFFYSCLMVPNLSKKQLPLQAPYGSVLGFLETQDLEWYWLANWGGSEEQSVLAMHPLAIYECMDQIDLEGFRGFCQMNGVPLHRQEVQVFPGATAGGIFGMLSYEAGFALDRVRAPRNRSKGLPVARFGFFPVVAVYSHRDHSWELSGRLSEFPEYAATLAKHFIQGNEVSSLSTKGLRTEMSIPVGASEYGDWVRRAKEAIRRGDIYQANLAHPIHVSGSEPLTHIFRRIHAQNPSPWACMAMSPECTIVSNSPELLLKMECGQITSKPIAGTRPRGEDGRADELLRRSLIRSPKERAEHLMLVDLIRNDLGKVCKAGSVHVPLLMDREQYRNVTHIVSTVEGDIDSSKDGVDALVALFPGGTITGTPKIRSMEIIDSLETHPRGFYTGSLGYFAQTGNMEFNILIRTLQAQRVSCGWEAKLHVGAGIVADSNPEREYQETLHKASAWRRILETPGEE